MSIVTKFGMLAAVAGILSMATRPVQAAGTTSLAVRPVQGSVADEWVVVAACNGNGDAALYVQGYQVQAASPDVLGSLSGTGRQISRIPTSPRSLD